MCSLQLEILYIENNSNAKHYLYRLGYLSSWHKEMVTSTLKILPGLSLKQLIKETKICIIVCKIFKKGRGKKHSKHNFSQWFEGWLPLLKNIPYSERFKNCIVVSEYTAVLLERANRLYHQDISKCLSW